MIGHRLMGNSLLFSGDIVGARAHYDQAIALFDPAPHRPLATQLGDVGVAIFSYRAWALWSLGYPEAALGDTNHALKDARATGHAATLMVALGYALPIHIYCGDYAAANAHADELVALADEKGATLWKAAGMMNQGWVAALTGNASNAIQMITSGIAAWRSTGATTWMPLYLPLLARAYAELGQFENAWRSIGEAMTAVEKTKERTSEADIYCIAGKIELLSPQRDAAKAEAYFEQALAVARQQQAKSFELRAAMSLARLWRDQGKSQQARELLAPVYGWFTEGFDTRDLKEAKVLLKELAS
jgi:predicted ATPase